MKQTSLLVCAWVLWGAALMDDGRLNRYSWLRVDAFDTREACQARRSELTGQKKDLVWVCLPDTVQSPMPN